MAKVSTLLVIGNGFDLAHGMKTSYRDILNAIISYMAVGSQNIDFTSEEELKAYARKFDVDMINKVLKAYNNQWQKNHSRKYEAYKVTQLNGDLVNAYQYAINYLITYGNWWFQHFMRVLANRERRMGDGWVDFEAEIHRVVANIENILLNKPCDNDLAVVFGGYATDLIAMREQLIPELKSDLNILNVIIEFYLNQEEVHGEEKKIKLIDSIENVRVILSYNYTHTYQNVYDESFKNIYYLHGEVKEHNLVLGTDETLSNDLKNTLLECADFKKIYQLIYYRLGNRFKHIFPRPDFDSSEWNAVIYGHSLTPADSYSLGWLFQKSNTNLFAGRIKHITIYYYDEKAYNEQLANLFQIIGQERVLEYTSNGDIEFKKIRN
ncbi:MAG: hypothetical protein J6O13_16005 [Selenomonas sp.]|nr:hypothetical protein [Selenomonas sp.]